MWFIFYLLCGMLLMYFSTKKIKGDDSYVIKTIHFVLEWIEFLFLCLIWPFFVVVFFIGLIYNLLNFDQIFKDTEVE